MGFKTTTYIQIRQEDYDVCIIDSTGYYQAFMQLQLMSFVGGSLVPRGGHNLIEPAALGSPIIIGPHTFNFEDIVHQFLHDQACIQVSSEDELLTAMESLY